jgi:hypothetical protein
MRSSVVRILAVVALAVTSTACHRYVPRGVAPVPRGTPVHVRLEQPSSFRLPSMTAHRIDRLTAEMVREDRDAVVLSALRLASVEGEDFDGRNATLSVARADIAALEVRRVSTWRTAFVVAGGLLGTWLGFEAFGGGSAGGEGPDGGGQIH